ncbi:hypothetical protein AVEN_255437-1 [Araneus ventricosus]|uniref:Mos1 transposase HTH domain-containing protein n=1 Tax=Araneus ventricosus TaxID=182803 RepID=A0A4Y2HPI7_ARAVE|nr:hypothetical protein AVEN_255437-1 [Araneus ventricosus]
MHQPTCEVYGGNAMSDSKVRKWVKLFKNVGKTSISNRILIGNLESIAESWKLCFGTGKVFCYWVTSSPNGKRKRCHKGHLFRNLVAFLSGRH